MPGTVSPDLYPRRMLERIDHGPVRELRLAHPPANALSPALIAALGDAIRAAPGEGARALFLSGHEGMFSAGLDVPAFLALDRAGLGRTWEDFFALMETMASSPIPLAAAITGHSPAGGCVLAFFCEWRVMADGPFRIGLNEVAVGVRIPPPIHAAARHVLGSRGAERICTSAELFEVDDALRLGLIDEVAPPDEVVPRALAWCERMIALPPAALRKTRMVARRELIEVCAAMDAAARERFLDDWFAEETQAVFRGLAEKLRQK